MAEWGELAAFSDEEDAREEEEEDMTQDHVMCLVDCQRAMFQPSGDEKRSCFGMTAAIITTLLKKKIIESDKNKVGVVLYGSRLKSENSPQSHVYALLPLETPSAHAIKHMEELTHLGEDSDPGSDGFLAGSEFGGPMDVGEPCPLRHGIWRCNQIFAATGVSKRSSRRIWLFTNDDNPFAHNPEEVEAAVTSARDAAENGVVIDLFHMQATPSHGVPASDFDASKFYHCLLSVDMEEEFLEDRVHAARTLKDLQSRLRRKSHVKRCLARLPLVLSAGSRVKKEGEQEGQKGVGDGAASSSPPPGHSELPRVAFQVQLVVTTGATKIPSIMLDGATNEQVKTQSRALCETTGEYLDDLDIRTYMEVGGRNDRAYISRAELKQLKVWGEPGITVLGFLPLSWLQPWYNVRSPYFVYPDESSMKGSVLAASALLKAMVAKCKLAVARFVRNSASAPQLVALLPQEEDIDDEDGSQIDPPGFNVVVLPFADDFRDVPAEAPPLVDVEATAKRRAAALRLVSSISLDMENSSEHGIHNPVLQKQYAMLQALALGEHTPDWDERVDDNLCPPPEFGSISGHISAFFSELPLDVAAKSTKRPAASSTSSTSPAKRPKSAGGSQQAPVDWAKVFAEGSLHKQSVAALKSFLKDKGIGPLSNKKKADLVEMANLAIASENV